MADYKIDVRAALDVKGYKEQLDKITLGRIIDVKLNPKVDFKVELNSETLAELTGLKDRIQKWFNEPENQIAINITYQPDDKLKKQLETIRNAIKTVAPINIPVNADTKKINSLATALIKIGDAYKNIDDNKSIYIYVDSNAEQSQQKLDSLKQQINIVKETLKNFEPVLINIGFKTEDLAKLYKNIIDIQDKLKSLENIEIKPPDNLVNNIKNSLQDIKMGIEFDEEKKKNFEESISNLNLLLNSLRKIEIEVDLNQEQKEKLNNTITEINSLLNSLRIIEIEINFNEQQKKEFEDSINSLKDNSNIEINVKFNETQKDKLTQDVTNATQSLSSLKNIEIGINESQKSQIKKDIEDIETSLNSLKNIPINIGISDAQKNQLIQSIDNIVNSLNEITKNVKIGIAFDENSKEQLSKEIASIALLLHTLQEVEIKASFTQESKEQLSKEISTIALLLNALEKVEIHIGFAQDSKEQLNKEIASTALLLNALQNVEINIKFNQEQKQKLGEDIASIALLLKTLQDGIEIKISNPSNENLQDIKKYIDDYFSNNPVNLNFQANINGQNGAQNVQNTFNQLNQHIENTVGQMNNAVNQLNQNIQNNVRDTTNNITNNTLRVGDTIRNTLDQSQRQYNTLDQSVRVRFNETNRLVINNIQRTYNTARDAVNNTRGIFDDLMRYFGVQRIFSAVQNSFQQMIKEVRDLDIELTEFSKVTDLTTEETEKFINKAYELGDAVARTGTEVVQATTLFKKMGYELQESMGFAEDALMWTNVADGLVTVESAATMLISTMKAFEEQGISSTHVIDALNEVSNNYSTSSSALSDNLSAVSATLAVSGTSFEQTIGLMTAGIEIMPDKASKVANGLKTISQRIRQIDGATADKLDEFFGSKGISRFDELTGELKGTYDILEEVSKVWNTLTINERQYIGEVMAGKNQITVLNALMMNFATAINATETAMNSAGSAARENERVLDSIQGHIQRFQSAFEELSQNLINSNVFKQVVDFGTNLIKILNTLAKNSVSLTLVLSGVGITTAVNWWQRLGEAFQQAQTRASDLNQTLQSTNRIDYFASTISGLQTVIATASIAITMFTALNQHYQNIEAEKKRTIQDNIDNRKKEFDSIEQLKKLEEEYLKTDIKDTEKRNQLFEKIYDKKVEIANLDNDGLSRNKLLNTSIGEQNDLYDNQLDKVSRTTLELIRQKQLLEEYGKSNIFAQFFANLFPNAPWLEENINPLGDFYNNDYFGGKNFQDFYDTTLVSIQNKIETLTSLQNHIEEIRNSFDPGTEYYELYNQQYDFLAEKIEKLKGKNDEISASAKEAAKTTLGDLSTYTDEQLEAMSKVFDAYANFGISGAEGLELALKELVDVFGSDLEENFLQEIQDKFNDPEIAQAALNLINYFLEVKKAASDIPYSYSEAMGEMLSVVTSTTTKIQERYDLLTQAVDEFNESGVITKETLQSLTENDLLKYLQILDGQISLDTKAFDEDTKATKENSASKIDNQLNANLLKLANEKLKDSLNDLKPGSDNASSGIDNVSTSAIEATKTLIECGLASDETAKALNELGKLIGKEDLNLNNFDAEGFISEAQRLMDAANNAKNALNDFNPTINRGASSSRTSGGSSSSSSSSASRQAEREAQQAQRDAERAQREAEQAAKQAQQDWKEAFKVEYNKLKTYLDSEIITYEQYYAALEELNKHFFEGRSEFEEEYWKYQDEVVKGRKKYLEDELKDYFQKGEKILKHQLNVEYITEEEYYDALTLLYESYYTDKEKYEEEYWKLEEEIYKLRKKQIKELEDELKDLYKEIEDLHKEYVKSLEDDLDEIETTISFAIDVIDEEIQKLKDEKTAIDEANEAREESIKLQELEDALEKAKNKKVRVYKKGEGFVYEQDTTAISQAQTALDKYKQEAQHKKRLSNIDEEIKKLEEYKKEWQNISVNYKKAQDEMTAKAILGESAREEVLRREHNAVTKVGNRYVAVKNAIIKANEATIDNLEAYIGDATQAGTFSYEIERIKNKINEIQSKTVTLQVNTSQASTSVSNIIVAIDALKNKLESKYSTQNLNAWLASYKSMINEAYHYNPSGGSTGGGGSGSSGGGSSSGGNNQSDSGNTNTPDGKPAIGTHVRLKQPNNYLYGDQEFEIWGYDYKGDPQIRWLGSSDKDNPTYAVSLSELEGYGENTDTNIVNPGDTITEDGVYKYADQNGNYTPMDVIWEGGQKYYYNPVTGQKIPVVSGGGGGEAGVYNGGGGSDDDIYYYEPIDWQGQGYESIGEYYADYRRQMEDYYHNLYGYHASGTIGTTTKKFVINENGIEAMVTPDGTVISAPSTGYGVIKNEYTKRLTDFAADPLSFLSRMFTGYSGTYQNNNNAKNEVININGNLTLPNVTDGQSFVDSIRNVALQYTTRRR